MQIDSVLWPAVLTRNPVTPGRWRLQLACTVAAALTAVAPGVAQGSASTTSPADSVRVLRAAREAQRHFESVRRRNLPSTWRSGGGPCDERIGRFCLTHDDSEDETDDWAPPPEPAPTRRARLRLMAQLDSAAARLPGDRWIAGQRVRYLAEAEQTSRGREAALACRAHQAWCAALAGFAAHAARDFGVADSAYAVALAAMTERERREWTDLTLLFEPTEAGRFRRLRGVPRDSVARRFWWLADPLWSTPGNERRTEHFSRHVWDRLQDRAKSPETVSWGEDLRELLIRYGWPIGWEQVREGTPSLGALPSIVSHYPPRARRWDPPWRVLANPTRVTAEDWPTRVRRAHSEYKPAYADRWNALEHQLARFRRGDSLLLVATWRTPRDTAPASRDGSPPARGPAGGSYRAALLAAPNEQTAPTWVTRSDTAGRGAFLHAVPNRPTLFSLELLAEPDSSTALQRPGAALQPPVAPWAARARYAAAPLRDSAGVASSDLLLTDAVSPTPVTLEQAIAIARPDARMQPGDRFGLYWEAYGLTAPNREVTVSVRLLRQGRDWLGRASPVEIRLRERLPDGPIFRRGLAIGLPENLPNGTYLLTVAVAPDQGPPATASRRLLIERGGSER